jgi:hypothetical protein
MKKIHIKATKFHVIYTALLAVLFLIVAIIAKDILLSVVMLIVTLYVAGNGIIQTKKSELSRDAIVEYILVSAIVVVVTVGVLG